MVVMTWSYPTLRSNSKAVLQDRDCIPVALHFVLCIFYGSEKA